MTIVMLIRHGENEYVKKGRLAGRMPGIHLNDRGRGQAQALGDKLAESSVKAVYSSPLERALETAEPIAIRLGLPVVTLPGLIEVDCGEWQGESLKKLGRLKVWRQVIGSPSLFRFPSGETFRDAQARIVNEITELVSRHDPQDIIICVSHSDPIRLAVAFFIGLPLDGFQRLMVSPGSITTIMVRESSANLVALNYDPSFSFSKP